MGLLALYQHGSTVTGDQVDGSDVDVLAVVEHEHEIVQERSNVLRSGTLDRWPDRPLDLEVVAVDSLHAVHRGQILGGELLDGHPLDLGPPTPDEWVFDAQRCAETSRLDGRIVAAAMWAAAARAVEAGAPIPAGKRAGVDAYRTHVAGPWADTVERFYVERRAVTAELEANARTFLEAADDAEYTHRIVAAVASIPDRTTDENWMVDPSSRPFVLIPGWLTPEQCDRALELNQRCESRPRLTYSGRTPENGLCIGAKSDPDDPDTAWLNDLLDPVIVATNNSVWCYDLLVRPGAELKGYATGSKLFWHADLAPGQSTAKLFAVVLASDPADFTGGQLEIMAPAFGRETIKLARGDGVIIPTWVPHRVTKVRSGYRWSIVSQIHGRSFR